jgi:hypothetical protein
MHLIIDIRQSSPIDPIIVRYAENWVDLWIARHPTDIVSYIHYSGQDCPENGRSLIVSPPSWWWGRKRLSIWDTNEIFRCINFSPYPPYDPSITTTSHIWDHAGILYPRETPPLFERYTHTIADIRNNKNNTIIVPSLTVGQEAVEITHIPEAAIEIIPYITMHPGKWDRHTLSQLSISGSYWLYDGSYGSESGIVNLLKWYKSYRDLGGTHILLLAGRQSSLETRDIALQIQSLSLTGSVRIIWALESESIESLYLHASGWIYVGAYYSGGPRVELARSHHIPLLIPDIPSLIDYHSDAMTIHPSHLSGLGQAIRDLEHMDKKENRKISNDNIMIGYERVISQKR